MSRTDRKERTGAEMGADAIFMVLASWVAVMAWMVVAAVFLGEVNR